MEYFCGFRFRFRAHTAGQICPRSLRAGANEAAEPPRFGAGCEIPASAAVMRPGLMLETGRQV